MRHSNYRRAALGTVVAGLIVLPAAPAFAHGEVDQGGLVLTIGFADEPAFAGQPNAVQLVVEHDGEPVIDLRPGDVTVEITYGDDTSEPMDLTPAFFFEAGRLVFGEAGDYHADFVPSQPGRYTFHLTGTIEGEKVDQEMTSGPATFSVVEDAASMSFPAVDTPSIEEVVTRIDAESARAADGVTAAEAAAASADDAASSARTVGIAGIVLGAIGIIAALVAIASGRRKA